MFRTIIWATDGSETADRAMPYAKELAGGADGRLIVVHSKELLVGRAGGHPVLADEDEVETKIEAQVEQLRADGLDASFRLVSGSAPSRGAHDLRRSGRGRSGSDRRRNTRSHGRGRSAARERDATFAPHRTVPRAGRARGCAGRCAAAGNVGGRNVVELDRLRRVLRTPGTTSNEDARRWLIRRRAAVAAPPRSRPASRARALPSARARTRRRARCR